MNRASVKMCKDAFPSLRYDLGFLLVFKALLYSLGLFLQIFQANLLGFRQAFFAGEFVNLAVQAIVFALEIGYDFILFFYGCIQVIKELRNNLCRERCGESDADVEQNIFGESESAGFCGGKIEALGLLFQILVVIIKAL